MKRLYFLSNISVDKFVYKFLEKGKTKFVLIYLISSLKRSGISLHDKKKFSDILLQCYVQYISEKFDYLHAEDIFYLKKTANIDKNLDEKGHPIEKKVQLSEEILSKIIKNETIEDNEIEELFHSFIEKSNEFDKQMALKILIQFGMIRDLFKVIENGCDFTKSIEIIIKQGNVDLGEIAFHSIREIIKLKSIKSDVIQVRNHRSYQDIIYNSPLFNSLTPNQQVEVILAFFNNISLIIH